MVPFKTHANTNKSLLNSVETRVFIAERLGLARTSHELTVTCCCLLGFYELTYSDVAICTGFEVVPLKTHANTSKSSNHIFKTNAISNNKTA